MQGDDEAEDGGEEHQHVQCGQGQQVIVTWSRDLVTHDT